MGVIISWQNNAVANVLFLTERFWLVFALLHKNFYKEQTKGWLPIAKLKPLSLFISLLFMIRKAFDNVKIEK